MIPVEAQWHRTQRTTDKCHATACTDASTLATIAAYTRGASGPDTSLDEFRAMQLDKVGGVDLYDTKYAARRLGVTMTVHAAYHPGPEYSAAVSEGLYDLPATTAYGAWHLLEEGRFGVLQLVYGALPPTLRHDTTFTGPHAIGLLGAANVGSTPSLLVADPLAASAHWHAAAAFWAAASELAGNGKVNLSVTPIRKPLWRVTVRLGPWWAYYRSAGKWTRQRRWTGGFSADCTPPDEMLVLGMERPMVRITSGVYAGTWANDDSLGVKVKEM